MMIHPAEGMTCLFKGGHKKLKVTPKKKFEMKALFQIVLLLTVSLLVWKRAFYLYDVSMEGMQEDNRIEEVLSSSSSSSSSASRSRADARVLRLPPVNHHHPHNSQGQEKGSLGPDNSNLFHFMQITDLHVSKFGKHGGLAHIEAFIYNELALVAPDLVLVTGDLTDAKSSHFLTSLQQEEEWTSYFDLLKASKVMERNKGQFWWDQRGNHDCWNVPSFQSSINFFKDYSSVKDEGYSFVLTKPFGKYSFVALDGCPITGAGRPFNFFGYLDSTDMDFLADLLLTSIREKHNHTFAMSHYPTGTTLYGRTSQGIGFWEMTQHVSVWFSGHLHKLAAGLGETMYAFQDNAVLELELGDMKSHGMFRIIAVDNDLVSFVDLPLHHHAPHLKLPLPTNETYRHSSHSPRNPIVLITNPKDGRYIIPGKEPTHLIATSSHIRVLIWAQESSSLGIEVLIDGVHMPYEPFFKGKGHSWNDITKTANSEPYLPLWVIPWNPEEFNDDSVHFLTVVAVDDSGLSGNQTVRFRIDGERIRQMDSGPGGFIISLPLGLLFKDLFIIIYIVIVIGFLLIPKLFVLITSSVGVYEHWKSTTSAMLVEIDVESQKFWSQVRPSFKVRIRHRFSDFKFTMVATFFRFCELSRKPRLFYPLYFFSLYILVGPWFIGDFVPADISGPGKRFGWLMVYGIWFQDGSWEPVLDTWLYAWYGLLYTLFPLVFYLSFCVLPPSLLYSPTNPRLLSPIHTRKSVKIIILCFMIYHLLDTCSMTIFYGLISTIISPGKTWVLLWAWVTLRRLGIFRSTTSKKGSLLESKQQQHEHSSITLTRSLDLLEKLE